MKLYNEEFADKHTTPLVDAIITDPPYNISREIHCLDWKGNHIPSMKFDKEDNWDSKSHEEYIIQLKNWSTLFGKVLRPGGHFFSFCANRYISHYWDTLEKNGIIIKRIWTWCKPNAMPFNRKVNLLSSCEYALWGIKPGKKKVFNFQGTNQHNYYIYPLEIGNKLHPNQKPLEIMRYLVNLFTNVGDVVLDPFMGSGTTGVACVNNERGFIGIEQDPKYFKVAKKRIEESSIKLKFL